MLLTVWRLRHSNWMGQQAGKRLILAHCPPHCVLILLAAVESVSSGLDLLCPLHVTLQTQCPRVNIPDQAQPGKPNICSHRESLKGQIRKTRLLGSVAAHTEASSIHSAGMHRRQAHRGICCCAGAHDTACKCPPIACIPSTSKMLVAPAQQLLVAIWT